MTPRMPPVLVTAPNARDVFAHSLTRYKNDTTPSPTLEGFLGASLFEVTVNERMYAENICKSRKCRGMRAELIRWNQRWAELETRE